MKKETLILGLIFIFSSFMIPQSVLKKADKEIKKWFVIDTFKKEIIDIPENMYQILPVEFKEQNFFKIYTNQKLLGYGYIGSATSKTDTFDFLVLFDTELIILKSSVLVYREDYGGEIASKRWLKQFNKHSIDSELKYQKEIIPISGATISARSFTKAINDLLHSLKILQEKNII